jgi:hypothetical protein
LIVASESRPADAISLVVFGSLIGFDLRFDAAKAGESGHSGWYTDGTLDMQAVVSRVLTFDSA